MLRRHPDRALRKLVTELAEVHPDDLAIILGNLDEDERGRIEALLSEYRQKPAVVEVVAQAVDAPEWRIEGASPWLLDRLNAAASERGASGDTPITEAALAALRAAAEPFRSTVVLLPVAPPTGPSLAGRVKRAVLRRSA